MCRMMSLTYEQHERLLQSIKRPLRQLSIYNRATREATFELYRPHFSTLEKLDLMCYNGNTSTAAIQVLSSCPNLKSFLANGVHAQDILNTEEGNRPWVCHGLEELGIFIDMGFENNGPYRRFTNGELYQCRAVFKRLATFKQLRSLDTLSYPVTSGVITMSRNHTENLVGHTLVPLPFRLGAGLDELAGLSQLVDVRFWAGSHAIFKKEIVWMLDHWKRLRNIGAGQTTGVERYDTPDELSRRTGIASLLNVRDISTHGAGAWRHAGWERVEDILEDCCGEFS
ncbi:hypothetical protein B0O80DRAFT_474688 [Mortierella sp. GBAus27b]|nr:hypothetical protein B0O80DRAFT_474688 [Mortierella sp. GBAus27b]